MALQAPVEVEPYTEEYDATDDGNVCPQYDIGSGGPAGDEDCLNLNVYTPKIDDKKRAVMVYIHGGAFIMGGGASYFFGPNYLLENDVVLVTFNYRLGVFGFLATDDKAATGNYGIMDQVAVLKWVKKNIDKFATYRIDLIISTMIIVSKFMTNECCTSTFKTEGIPFCIKLYF